MYVRLERGGLNALMLLSIWCRWNWGKQRLGLGCMCRRVPTPTSSVTAMGCPLRRVGEARYSSVCCLSSFMCPTKVARYSTHSLRTFLACAAYEAGCPPEEIQALCMWRSPESLQAYIRWSPGGRHRRTRTKWPQRCIGKYPRSMWLIFFHLESGPLIQAMAHMAEDTADAT